MWKDCQALQDEITALRLELHQIPEVGAQLPETAACLSAHLDRLGIPFVRSPRDSGLIASIQGGLPGRTVALRADMDALPIQEETGLPFSSRRPGVMHACGHDAHAAMLMGAAQVLQKHRKELRGTVRLLFQPAEEQCEGAKVMLEQGALDGVDAIFGFHIGTLPGARLPWLHPGKRGRPRQCGRPHRSVPPGHHHPGDQRRSLPGPDHRQDPGGRPV